MLALAQLIALANTKTVIATSVNNITPEPIVSFTFDDGLSSVYDKAAPVLATYGFRGTSYVIPDCVGTKGSCAANPDASYMGWAQLKELQSNFKWEIGSHSLTHPSLSSLAPAKQEYELRESKLALAKEGIDARSFASPYGDYNHDTLAIAAKYYQSHRGFWDNGHNRWPYNDLLLSVRQVQVGVSVGQVEHYIDEAVASHQWLILVFHDIKETPSDDPEDFEYSTAGLDQIAAYVKQKQIRVSTVSDGIITSNVNLLGDGSFNKGLNGGWSTDTPRQVKADGSDHGSFPEPEHAISVRSTSSSAHLFSPKIKVSDNTTYMIKSFLNVTKQSGGEIGYYIDEYDAKGRWISGQWKVSEPTVFVETINFTYRPSSPSVRKARLQVYSTPSRGLEAYVDSVSWFPLSK